MASKNLSTKQDLSFEELLAKYDYNFQKGDLVKGKAVAYGSYGALIDIGAKTTALVPNKEVIARGDLTIKDVLEKGKEYEFLIIREEDEDGQLLLSHKKVTQAYAWKTLEDIKEKDGTIEGEIMSTVKGGAIVEAEGIRGFIPSSHLRVKLSEDLIGEKLELKILSMDSQANNLILSNRKAYGETAAEAKKDLFESIETGQSVEGEIVRLADFGAFVDIGGVDGLLPLSQMSWKWVDHPGDILKVGDKIKTEIIAIDTDKQRVSLSLKNLQEDPWDGVKDNIKEGEKVKGTITRIKPFGAFVEIFPGVEALLPQKEFLKYQNTKGSFVEPGEKIEAVIVRFNPEDRRVSLAIPRVEEEAPKKAKKDTSKEEDASE